MMQVELDFCFSISDVQQLYVCLVSNDMVLLLMLISIELVLGLDVGNWYNLYCLAILWVVVFDGVFSGEVMVEFECVVWVQLLDGYQIEWIGMSYQE